MKIGAGTVLLGAFSMGITVLADGTLPVVLQDTPGAGFLSGFYSSIGIGLMAAGMVLLVKNRNYLKNPDLRKRKEIMETDERNRLLGLRCWAYTGYTMFLLLYIGMLVSGFVSVTAVMVFQIIIAVYALLLLFFKILLNRSM